MTASTDEQIRAAIAEQAAEWFVANDAGPLEGAESAALVAWLKASPVHVEEFLRVALIARDFNGIGPGLGSTENLIARAQTGDDGPIHGYWSGALAAARNFTVPGWRTAVATIVAIATISLGAFWLLNPANIANPSRAKEVTVLRFATHHGEQQTHVLPDHSVLHINTDTSITVRYDKTERRIALESGEADFEVAHERDRAFLVFAGPAQAIAHGTQFDVRLEGELALVTVIEGRVGVARNGTAPQAGSNFKRIPELVELYANQQTSVSRNGWSMAPVPVDAHRATAWLHHQVAFDHEPLEKVIAELNRYTQKPIEIATPALRKLEITGIFSTDDSEELLAFLRSLDRVRIDVTATRIVVSER